MSVIADQIWMDGWHIATLSPALPPTVRAEAINRIINPPQSEDRYEEGYAEGVEETDRAAYARGYADALASVENHVGTLRARGAA
jgi:hypothetical protein